MNAAIQQIRLGCGQSVTAIAGFVQSTVRITYLQQGYSVWTSPVVGRSLARAIMEMLEPEFPHCELSIEDYRRDMSELPSALAESDHIGELVRRYRTSTHPGREILARTGLYHTAPKSELRD